MTTFAAVIGIIFGALSVLIGGNRAFEKADEKLGGAYPCLTQPKKHFMWYFIYLLPYILTGLLAGATLTVAVTLLVQ